MHTLKKFAANLLKYVLESGRFFFTKYFQSGQFHSLYHHKLSVKVMMNQREVNFSIAKLDAHCNQFNVLFVSLFFNLGTSIGTLFGSSVQLSDGSNLAISEHFFVLFQMCRGTPTTDTTVRSRGLLSSTNQSLRLHPHPYQNHHQMSSR